MLLSCKIKDIIFNNPILVASGTYGYGNEVKDLVDVSMLGGIVTKSVTLHPREGNNPPRITETPSGMLNSIGLANPGVEVFCKDKIAEYKQPRKIIIINELVDLDDIPKGPTKKILYRKLKEYLKKNQ